ncbi:uncharacterized protein EAF01_008519 [Botrytis porri]|uniref:uncharacterized protein n=1 Tax=Botrytis porri TaxID=87229 RepID=UPI00190183E3|nr:uncharacterized protein EAF01_008519 [Botrytis porri]KAF7899306.1 hypothetical protein EAF01_008519 [Botrytis porri]
MPLPKSLTLEGFHLPTECPGQLTIYSQRLLAIERRTIPDDHWHRFGGLLRTGANLTDEPFYVY